MKRTKLLTLVLVLSLLTACGGGNEGASQAENQGENIEPLAVENNIEEDSSDSNVDEDELGLIFEEDGVSVEMVKAKREMNEVYESGPFILTLDSVGLARMEVPEESAFFFDDKSEVNLVILGVSVENTSDETLAFYPDQGTLVTDTKEQKEANLFLSDDLGGDFYGQVKKEGAITIIIDSEPEDINRMSFHIGGPFGDGIDRVGEDISLEINF